jgi:hypothetical protein
MPNLQTVLKKYVSLLIAPTYVACPSDLRPLHLVVLTIHGKKRFEVLAVVLLRIQVF